jgi:hypothetical protein
LFNFGLWDFRNTNILEMKRKEFIRHNDNLYLIIEIYSEQRVKPGKTQELRELLECDIVLRKDGLLLFCEKIQEAEVIS